MRKLICILLSFILLLTNLNAVETSFEIVAYRVGGEGKGPFFYVVDALNNSLENMTAGESRSIDSLLSNYIGTELSESDPNNILLSFRVEGQTLGSYYVKLAVSHFALMQESEKGLERVPDGNQISGHYMIDNLDLRFNDSNSTEMDGVGTAKITEKTSNETQKDTKDTVDYDAADLSNASVVTWTIADNNQNDGIDFSSDYWICRGAVRLQIDENEYNNAPIGTYQTKVIVEWGTIE